MNRLADETSPYLLQHKDNPVHWWAWGPEALDDAKRTGKPILLSVGYAACHWCHVMAHESFEDADTAGVMNELFVNIKVDREERPDIDAIYMGALHRMGQQGGWPLTMFLDSAAKPFWGGTYFPPAPRWGKPAFADVLREVARIYREEPERVAHNTETLTRMLADQGASGGGLEITEPLLRDLTARMVRAVDPVHGGINGAPKFPQWSFFWLLWRGAIRYGHEQSKRAVVTTLTRICQGGIYDHLGGGFARYSTDERWLAPHFEKMLYDNALLLDLLTEVWRETHDPLFKVRIEETVAWLLSEMVAEGGAFAASLDADSEGEEGRFYVWSAEEIARVLGPGDAEFFSAAYDVTAEGNWEGHNILNRLAERVSDPPGQTPDHRTIRRSVSDPEGQTPTEEARLKSLREKLLAARTRRVRPGWDDKVLADWNGLMIAALARAAVVFERADWLAAAERAFTFIAANMEENGRLWHSWRRGKAKAPATASDYANMTWAAVRLYEAAQRPAQLAAAIRWTEVLDRDFWVADPGGYAMTAEGTSDVIVRLRNAHDDATPNANAVQLSNLVALFQLTGDIRYADRAGAVAQAFAPELAANLIGHAGLLAAAMDHLSPQMTVLAGRDLAGGAKLAEALGNLSLPGSVQVVVAGATSPGAAPGVTGKNAVTGSAACYVCAGTSCSPPLADPVELAALLEKVRSGNSEVAGGRL